VVQEPVGGFSLLANPLEWEGGDEAKAAMAAHTAALAASQRNASLLNAGRTRSARDADGAGSDRDAAQEPVSPTAAAAAAAQATSGGDTSVGLPWAAKASGLRYGSSTAISDSRLPDGLQQMPREMRGLSHQQAQVLADTRMSAKDRQEQSVEETLHGLGRRIA
jgi:hypothetical protein